MNISGNGQLVAIIKDDGLKKKNKIYVDDDEDKYESFQSMHLKKGRFQVVPDKKQFRNTFFIVGANGSGKSYWIRDYVLEFIKTFPTYPIRLFSSKNEDNNLDTIPQIKRIKIDESFVTTPVKYELLSKSLAIFDDIDAFDGKIRKAIFHLMDICLKNGRSYNIHVISTYHSSTNREISSALNESEGIVFFMKNYNRSMKYLLEGYIGLNSQQIKTLRKNKSRSTTYIKTYPNVFIQERDINTANALYDEDD